MHYIELCLTFHLKAFDGEYIYETDLDEEVCDV